MFATNIIGFPTILSGGYDGDAQTLFNAMTAQWPVLKQCEEANLPQGEE